MENHEYYISIGSNTAGAPRFMEAAIAFLRTLLSNCLVSDLYCTKPLGAKPVNDYTNAVACGTSTLDPEQLNRQLKEFEAAQGRTKEESKKGNVVIDLDIVTADGEILRPRDYSALHFRIGYEQLNPRK